MFKVTTKQVLDSIKGSELSMRYLRRNSKIKNNVPHVARYRMICLVLVNSHLFPLPCGAGSAVPREGFDLSVIILASLLVFPMLGCRHSLLRL